jgi:hypothetical protein
MQQRHRKEEHDKICIQVRKPTEAITFDLWLEYECIHYTKIFHYQNQTVQSSYNHPTHNVKRPKQWVFLKFNPKLFLILAVITLHQVGPSYILSMLYIFKEPWTLGSIGDNSNKTSPLKTIDKLFEQVSCLNPNFLAH